jgi:hypothetical protein
MDKVAVEILLAPESAKVVFGLDSNERALLSNQ